MMCFPSESEYLDRLNEMTPLVGASEEIAPSPTSYGVIDAQRHPLQRIPSEESIHSVRALPGMVIRCHAISVNTLGRGEGTNIRPSTAKVALKAVQQERRVARKRSQHVAFETGNALPVDTAGLTASSAMKESYWIDIETPQRSSADLSDFLKQLRLPPFFVSILSEPSYLNSEVIALKQVSLAIFQILPADPTDEIAHVALLSMPRLLVTFHSFPDNRNSDAEGGLYQLISQYMRQKERVPEPSNSGVLLAWLQFHVRRTARAIRELRLAVSDLVTLFCNPELFTHSLPLHFLADG